MRLRRDIRQYVEAELKYYHESKKELGMLRQDISQPGSDSTTERIGGFIPKVSKPTEDAVMTLLTNKRLCQLEQTVTAIDKTLERLGDWELELVRLLYWDTKYRPEGIAQKLHCNKRTVYRWRNQICESVAGELGLI